MQQNLQIDSAGNVWDMSSGKPVFVRGPQQSIQTKPADQKLPYEIQQAQGAANAAPFAAPKAQADVARAQAEARIAEAQAAIANAKNSTDLQIAQANLAKTQAELAGTKSGKGSALEALQAQVDRVGELYRQKIHGGLPNPIMGRLPTSVNDQFDAAAQGLTNPFMAAFRIPGVGSQSDTELRQFLAANTPSPHDTDLAIEEKMRNIQTRIDAERGKLGQEIGQPPVGSQEQIAPATGQTRSQIDPTLRATGNQVGAMIAQGVPDAQIKDFLQKSGVNPADTSIDQALQFRRTDDFKRWQRANPGQGYPIGPEFYTKQVPMSAVRRLDNKLASSGPAGSAAAFAASAANAITGDRLASAVGGLTGEPETARTGMQMMRSAHPFASLGGDIAGQMTDEALLGRIPGAQALMAGRWGRRGADALYGGFYGSGDDSGGDAATGGIGGAVTNMAGGMFGRGLQRGTGALATGVRNANLGYLNNAGVPLTVGQIGNGSDSVVGKALGGFEDRAAGLPIFDAIINSARRRGEQGFNSAAFREMGGSGATGATGVNEGQGLVDNAYNFLDGANIPVDPHFAAAQGAVRANLPNLPSYEAQIGKSMDSIDRAGASGSLTGRDWQSALRSTKSNAASLRGKEFSDDAINSLGDVERNLLDLAGRNGPPGAASDLTAANRLNMRFKTITNALDNGPSQRRGELFSAGRLDDASRQAARKFGGQTASMKGQRPFYDLTTAGMDVMPNQVPDSGTAGRALLYSTLFGGGVGGGLGFAGADEGQGKEGGLSGALKGLALSAALAAPYSKTGQKMLQKVLLGERPDRIKKIGDFLINQARYGGMFGAGGARDYFYQPELPQ